MLFASSGSTSAGSSTGKLNRWSSLLNWILVVSLFCFGALTHYHDQLRASGNPAGVLTYFLKPRTRPLNKGYGTSPTEELVVAGGGDEDDPSKTRKARRSLSSENRPALAGVASEFAENAEIEVISDNGEDELRLSSELSASPLSRSLHEETGEEAALHGEARVWTVITLFGLIIVMSIGFEEFQHGLIHHYKHTGQTQMLKMIDAMFKELTILGFVGLALMCIVKSGVLTAAAVIIFEHHHLKKHIHQHEEAIEHSEGGEIVHHHEVHYDRLLLERSSGSSTSGAGTVVPSEPSSPLRQLHGNFHDPIAAELFELFEAVHMMIFFVMVAFIALVGCLLIQSGMTRTKFHLCQNLRPDQKLTLKQKLLGGPTLIQDTIEFRLFQKEFFHPFDTKMQNPEAHPASFDFCEYLGVCMADFVVKLVEIPSVSFATLFVLLLAAKPAFRMERENREMFMLCLAWVISGVLVGVVIFARRIYYELLPMEYNPTNALSLASYSMVGATGKPKYQTRTYKRGSGKLIAITHGTRAPNKQEALFPFWRNGPELLAFTLQIALFLQAIMISVYLVHILPEETHWFQPVMQFVPLLFSLLVLWPSILYLFTIITSTGMMQQDEIVEEISRKVEAAQFKKYSTLITELEASALVHQIKNLDDGKVGLNTAYEKWFTGKLTEFHMTVPREQQHQIAEVFKTWDRDMSGAFDEGELSGLLQSQGRSHAAIESILRQWLLSGVFRPRIDPKTNKADDKEEGVMYSDEFKVFVLLEHELTGGDFDEDRLEGWLSQVLDKNGDGSVSVPEFLDSLGPVCKAADIDLPGVAKMFKIIEASDNEQQEVEEISIAKVLIWLKKYAIQKRKDSDGKKRGFMMSGGGGDAHAANDRTRVADEGMAAPKAAKSPSGKAGSPAVSGGTSAVPKAAGPGTAAVKSN
ncbi:unnamed protein product [Amoebophrya sp. A120]|nr:unnamed protein product [Amoebophrya sp. A120]|eukprot:GSA120T00008021001.1